MSGFAPGALRGFHHFTLTQPKDGADTEGQVGEFPEAPARGAKAEAEGGLPGARPGRGAGGDGRLAGPTACCHGAGIFYAARFPASSPVFGSKLTASLPSFRLPGQVCLSFCL